MTAVDLIIGLIAALLAIWVALLFWLSGRALHRLRAENEELRRLIKEEKGGRE